MMRRMLVLNVQRLMRLMSAGYLEQLASCVLELDDCAGRRDMTSGWPTRLAGSFRRYRKGAS